MNLPENRSAKSLYTLIFSISLALISASGTGQNINDFALTTPTGFIENKGQILNQNGEPNTDVIYLWASGQGMNVQFRPDGLSFDTYTKRKTSDNDEHKTQIDFHRLDMRLLGANPQAEMVAALPLPAHANFYAPGSKAEGLKSFEKILYENIYRRIDLEVGLSENGKQIKYDFILHPGADLSDIRIRYQGHDSVEEKDGALHFSLSGKTLTENIPMSWTLPGNNPTEVIYDIHHLENDAVEIGFAMKYPERSQTAHTLVIDPLVALHWSTYYGDSLYDTGNAIATDSLANVYIAGTTESLHSMASQDAYQSTFAGGQYDAFLVKFNQHGLRHWSTYYGGSGDDEALGVSAHTYDYVYMVGYTTSPDSIGTDSAFQTTAQGGRDGFVAKFNRLGHLVWDTYLGGENDDEAIAVFAEKNNQVYVTGHTSSANLFDSLTVPPFNPYGGGVDGFVAVFDTGGDLVKSTYFGGENDDFTTGIFVSDDGEIFLSGQTNSATGIASPGAFQSSLLGEKDGFVAKFDSNGMIAWSGYYGGPGMDATTGIVVNKQRLYITGYTDTETSLATDSTHQTAFSGVEDAYVASLDSTGSIIWYTYFGGTLSDRASAIGIDLDGDVYISGTTASPDSINFADDSLNTYLVGGTDVFLAKFDTAGTRIWSQYFGGEGDDEANAMAVYGFTAVFFTGKTASYANMAITFDPTNPIHQMDMGGDADAFVTRLTQPKSTPPPNVCVCPGDGGGSGGGSGGGGGGGGGGNPGIYQIGICYGDSIEINISGGCLGIGAQWVWYKDACGETDLYIGDGESIWVSPDSTTTYYVRAESVFDISGCTGRTIYVDYPPTATATISESVCPGSTATLTAGGALFYEWTGPDEFLSADQITMIDSLTAINEGDYQVVISTQFGCTDTASVHLDLLPAPAFEVFATNITCPGYDDGSLEASSNDTLALTWFWTHSGSGAPLQENLPPGDYSLVVTNELSCASIVDITLSAPELPLDTAAVTPEYCDQGNGSILLSFSGNENIYDILWMPGNGQGAALTDLSAGNFIALITDSIGCTFTTDSFLVENLGHFTAVITPDSLFLELEQVADLVVFALPETENLSYQWSPGEGLSCTTCPDPIANPALSVTYTAVLTSALGCTSSDSVFVRRAIPPSTAFLPSIFSPNSDGLNDLLCVMGDRVVAVNLKIFNRWGENVFSTKNQLDCWDGFFNGKPVDPGSLVYSLHLVLDDGEQISKSGNINIVR